MSKAGFYYGCMIATRYDETTRIFHIRAKLSHGVFENEQDCKDSIYVQFVAMYPEFEFENHNIPINRVSEMEERDDN